MMIPNSNFLTRFLAALVAEKRELFPRAPAPLISVSGGQDSVFLAWVVFHLYALPEFRALPTTDALQSRGPVCLYHNHLWHAEGFFHGLHCLRLAFIFGWPFVSTLPFHAIFDEDGAWEFRQRLRRRLCVFYATPEVCVGQTKTDQMEAFLFHLFRGSLGSFAAVDRQALMDHDAHPVAQTTGPQSVESTPFHLFALDASTFTFEQPTFSSSAYASLVSPAMSHATAHATTDG